MTETQTIADKAKAFGAATMHEAAGRIGALPSAIKPINPSWRLAGPAFTVQCPAGDNLWIHRSLYRANPGDVLVVYPSGGIDWGYWGDIMTNAAISVGLAGLVIDGGVRDTAVLERMDFPIFSNGVCIRGTIKDHQGTAFLGKPILIGDVVIQSGDLIVADRDGVVAVPAGDIAKTLLSAERREEDEAAKVERIRRGERTVDIYGWGPGV